MTTSILTDQNIEPNINRAIDALVECFRSGGKLLCCGNGGSAADCEHIVGELMKGFFLPRTLSEADKTHLQNSDAEDGAFLADKLQYGLPAISLVSQVSIISATANDQAGELVYAQQVWGYGRKEDILLAISTSGNSRNVLLAAKTARAVGMTVISLSGETGGQLHELSDIMINVPSRNVARIQEAHLMIYHHLCAAVEETFYGLAEGPTSPSKTALPEFSADGYSPAEITARLRKIKTVIFDFDGVFSDNKVITSQDGHESVICDRSDGLGIASLRNIGVEMMILSTETNPVVASRGAKLGLPVEQGCDDKAEFLKSWVKKRNLDFAEIAYIGNDINDLEAMKLVGLKVAPADSHPDILALADLVTRKDGGHGAVREFCDKVVSAKTDYRHD